MEIKTTNEEKAREYQTSIERNNPSAEAYGFYNAYLSACEWKDQQFKDYLKSKSEELRKKMKESKITNHTTLYTWYDGNLAGVEGVLKELFLKKEPKYNVWNKVSDALPECMKNVLVRYSDGTKTITYRANHFIGETKDLKVTHWMYIPELKDE